MKPRLLVLTSSYPRGPGDPTSGYVRQLAIELSRRFTVTILTSSSPGAPVREEADGLSVVRVHYFFPRWAERLSSTSDKWVTYRRSLLARCQVPAYLACFFLQAARQAKEADLILSHWLVPAGLIGAWMARRSGKPHVVIEHSGAFRALRRIPCGKALTRFIVTQSQRVITVSAELREQLIDWVPEAGRKTSVIPMGIDRKAQAKFGRSPQACPIPVGAPGSKVVLYLGRLSAVKGVDRLIMAMQGLAEAALVVAGDGEESGALRKLADDSRVPVHFTGLANESEKWSWLDRCDLVVIPSVILPNGRTEGLPVVCLEALAAGKPVVASRVGGLAEVIQHGENGLLVEPSNITELRQAIHRLLTDDLMRRRMGERGRAMTERFDWSVIGRAFEEAIMGALRP